MATNRITLSKISKALNLSVSTISKSLSDSPEISDITKKRVKEFAAQCKYTPNNLAASFRRGFTNTIGLIIPNISNPFYAKILIGIEKYLDENGYKLITSISGDSIEKETKNISVMTNGFVDGVIICISKEAVLKQDYDHINSIVNNGIPLTMFDRICDEVICDKVIINDFGAAFEAVESLIHSGCKHIIMTSPTKKLKHHNLREQGFLAAIENHKHTVKGTVISVDSIKLLADTLNASIKEDPSIDGVFAINQKAVKQALLIKQQIEKEQQRTIKIAGFSDDTQKSNDNSLITINQNALSIGKESAKLLLNRIKVQNKEPFVTETVNVQLV
ncbi:HTH-type transcriptional regulator DegA [Kordia antarctica]|uniref:HTH-type transcriptional regulator DegA n=1 Tax=Kordia antarctica TaxID=1218801 RepID=A0A7L4ZRZ4_9FLAO|nr:LacI family DNA-binding transcriptional regulator [Kordia antarctica]QHI39210.1 HTH-type transcriptional regulator DegA [Kordia antarctica]